MILKRMGGIIAADGVRVASVTHPHTGLTVVVLPPGATGGAAVRGGAPATREVELLYPENMVPGPDAVLLTGGSAFGLAAADGVVRALVDAGRGFPAGPARVPIVPALALFDLKGSAPEAPTPDDGWRATNQALTRAAAIQEGRAGAGAGATVGKLTGAAPMPGGQGAATVEGGGVNISALMVVNAVGSVVDDAGQVLAGPVGPSGEPARWLESLEGFPMGAGIGATTIGVVVVGGTLDKAGLARVSSMAHDGLARAISPAHTPWDGDAIVAVAVGGPRVDVGWAGILAAEATALAVRRAVQVGGPGPTARHR